MMCLNYASLVGFLAIPLIGGILHNVATSLILRRYGRKCENVGFLQQITEHKKHYPDGGQSPYGIIPSVKDLCQKSVKILIKPLAAV